MAFKISLLLPAPAEAGITQLIFGRVCHSFSDCLPSPSRNRKFLGVAIRWNLGGTGSTGSRRILRSASVSAMQDEELEDMGEAEAKSSPIFPEAFFIEAAVRDSCQEFTLMPSVIPKP